MRTTGRSLGARPVGIRVPNFRITLNAKDCERPMAGLISAATPFPMTRDKVLVVFSGLLLVMLLAALDSTIVATALPTIVGEMGGLAHLSWVVTAYLLAETIVTPLYGKLGDIYGRKGILQVGIVVFLLGSAMCGMSRS